MYFPEIIKKNIVLKLIEEISLLGTEDMELVGNKLVSFMINKRMVHHGINKDYRHVGYTVDSFSQNSSIIAEYSVEKGYFDNKGTVDYPKYPKIEKDLNHALSHNPSTKIEKIYLLSSQEENESFRAGFNKTRCFKDNSNLIEFLDARELAKIIYEQSVTNTSLADFYKQYFPSLHQVLDNYEYYGKIPAQCDGFIRDDDIINILEEHYQSGKEICVLSGISGSGKSQAAISFVHYKSKEYENYIWISGDDWKENTSLAAIQRTRGGTAINVEGCFNSTKTILIIDSYEKNLNEKDFSALRSGFDKGGIVLITSQINCPTNDKYISKPVLNSDIAYKILNQDKQCASPNCKKFVEICRFSPLILSAVRKISEDSNISSEDSNSVKDEIYNEALTTPNDIPNSKGASIMRTILDKLEENTRIALKKIANSGVTKHDIQFINSFIGYTQSVHLQRLNFLSPTNAPNIFKVHDFICLAIRDKINASELTDAIDRYIGIVNGDMTPSVLREIYLTRNELENAHRSGNYILGGWLTYALLQIENDEKKNIYSKLYNDQLTPSLSLSKLKCIVDAKELYAYTIESKSERQVFYTSCAEEYKKLAKCNVDDNIKAELLHHRAKSLRRCGKYFEAFNCFNELRELKPNWHATYGQIANLGSQYNVDNNIKIEGENALLHLLKIISDNSSKVPLRVSLAAIARLRSYSVVAKKFDKDLEKVKKLASIVALSALEGLDQFYEAFVSFTSVFSYHNSEVCIELSEDVSNMLSLSPEFVVEKRQWVSACEALTNVAIAAEAAEKHDLSEKLTNSSLQFAEKLYQESKLKSYDARALAKAYINAKDPDKALSAISKVEEKDIDHWLLYRKVEALIDKKKFDLALENSKKAYELAKQDGNAKGRISIYHEQLSKCYSLTGNSDLAINEVKLAISNCNDEQYKETLLAAHQALISN